MGRFDFWGKMAEKKEYEAISQTALPTLLGFLLPVLLLPLRGNG